MRRLPAFAYLLATLAVVAGTAVTAAPVAAASPVAVDDTYWTTAGTLLSVPAPGVLANDSDADGDGLAVAFGTPPAHESWFTMSYTGTFQYTPMVGFTGVDTFTYSADDGFNQSALATVSIHVVNVPTAVADSYTVSKNNTLVVGGAGVLANDSGTSGEQLATELEAGPAHGTLTLSADGSFTFAPTPGYEGPDGFQYEACVVGAPSICSSTVTVTLTVANNAPVTGSDSYTTSGFGALQVAAPGFLANDHDPNGDPMTVQLVSPPGGPRNGYLALQADGSFTYTPNAGYAGSEMFPYEACDSDGACSGGWVTITVPLGVHRNTSVTSAASLVTISTLLTAPAHGTVVVNPNQSFTYAPAAGYVGPDSFSTGMCLPMPPLPGCMPMPSQVFDINVVNDPAFAVPDALTVAENGSVSSAAPGVLSNDADQNGDPLTAELVATPSHGTLNLSPDGSYTYSPAANYHGADSFTYRACDDLDACSAAATVDVTVIESPVGVADSYGTGAGEELDVAAPGVLANDTWPGGATVAAVADVNPAHGTLSLHSDGSLTYQPAAGYAGTDSFTYRVCRTETEIDVCSAAVTDHIDVAAANRRPAFAPGTDGATWTVTPGSLPPAVVATDPDGDSVMFDLVDGTLPAGLMLGTDGTWSGSTTGLSGEFELTIRACDTHEACVTADVTLDFSAEEPTASPSTSASPTASATASPTASPSASPSASASASPSASAASASPSATAHITPPPTSGRNGSGSDDGTNGFVVVLLAGLLAISVSIAAAARGSRAGTRRGSSVK